MVYDNDAPPNRPDVPEVASTRLERSSREERAKARNLIVQYLRQKDANKLDPASVTANRLVGTMNPEFN